MSVESTDPTPNYRQLSDDVFERRIADLRERYADCDLCAYECYVDRTDGRVGTCQVEILLTSRRTSRTSARRTA